MKHITAYTFALSLFLFFGCLSGPDASRINLNDPDSELFNPKFSDLQVRASKTDKRITMFWINRSDYNEGFIIKRRFSSKGKFEPVDTITTSSYAELLTSYSLDMEYQVSSYFLRNNNIELGQSSETESIDYGGLTNLAYTSQSDTVFVQWFRRTAFDDRVTIEYKDQNATEWSIIATVQQAEVNGEFHRTSFVLPKGKNYDLRIEASLQNNKNEYETFYEREFSLNHQ